MHIITGLIVAGLTGRRRRGRPVVTTFRTGPVQTVHYLPGRVRFRVPSLASDANGAVRLVERLPHVEGVDSVDVSPATGSVLITYRQKEVQPELLFAAVVRLLDLDEEVRRLPVPTLAREIRSAADSLNRAVYVQTGGVIDLWSALLIVLAAIGARKLLAEGARSFPTGFVLLWWSLTSLLSGPRNGGDR
ncbi:MAG: HMA2 domain-containing protein [Planctomycetota bacterium]|jgi:copper chaperone CopZ